MCDFWSNESVQNVRLLSGNAPEVFTEVLAYDCRLMNTATAKGMALPLRDLLSESDEWLSPQAAVLTPEATMQIARAIVAEKTDHLRTVAAGHAAVDILRRGLAEKRMDLRAKELQWIDRIECQLDRLPRDSDELRSAVAEDYGSLYLSTSYGF